MSPDLTWKQAFDAVSQEIRRHPDFRQLVREVAVAEESSRFGWLRRNSMTFGSWTTRGMPVVRNGGLKRRARLFSARIAEQLGLWPERPREAEARVYVEARGFVQSRERG